MPYQNPYIPQQSFQQQYQPQNYMTAGTSPMLMQQQPIHGFIHVTGIEGAKAYPLPPNSEMPLFDSTHDGVMFIKTTDAAGFPTIKSSHWVGDDEQPVQAEVEYVTQDELQKVYTEISNRLEQMNGALHALIPAASGTAEPRVGAHASPAANDGR